MQGRRLTRNQHWSMIFCSAMKKPCTTNCCGRKFVPQTIETLFWIMTLLTRSRHITNWNLCIPILYTLVLGILTEPQRLIHALNLGAPAPNTNIVDSTASVPTNTSRRKRQDSRQCPATEVCQNMDYSLRSKKRYFNINIIIELWWSYTGCTERSECKAEHGNNCTLRTLIFILDTSGSVGSSDFSMMIDTISRFLPLFCGSMQLAILTYSSDIYMELCFDCYNLTCQDQQLCPDRTSLHSAIKAIQYRGGNTRTGPATRCVHDYVLDPLSGCKVDISSDCVDIIYITDGMSNGPLAHPHTCNEANCLKNHPIWCGRVNTYAIGIGDRVNLHELQCLTKSDIDESVFKVSNVTDLDQLVTNATMLLSSNPSYTCINSKDRTISLD